MIIAKLVVVEHDEALVAHKGRFTAHKDIQSIIFSTEKVPPAIVCVICRSYRSNEIHGFAID